MKIQTTLTALSGLLLVVGCNQTSTTTALDETNDALRVQREFTNSLTPTSRDTNGTNRIYPDSAVSDAEKAAAKEADNTGKNVRDRTGETLTPGDQGTSKADVEVTRSVRKAIMDKDELSTTAKNIKIITADGKVTLRGPVKSTEEQNSIAEIAKGVAGVTSVDNQLEVKANN